MHAPVPPHRKPGGDTSEDHSLTSTTPLQPTVAAWQAHNGVPAIFAQSPPESLPFWRVYRGDSRRILDGLPKESVNCVVTSPPYYWQRDYGVEGQFGLEASIEGYVRHLRQTFRALRPVLAKDGTLFLNLGDTYYSAKGQPHGDDSKHRARRFGLRAVDGPGLGLPRKSLIGMPWRVALALARDGWTLRSAIIWVRKTALPEPTAHDRPHRKHEFIFLFAKGPRYHFNRTGLASEEDVWFIEPDRQAESRGVHYAPYPRELVERCLSAGCPEGGVVLDPFVGGGTTMSVALQAGRSAIGIDLSPTFAALVRDRLLREERSGAQLVVPEKTDAVPAQSPS